MRVEPTSPMLTVDETVPVFPPPRPPKEKVIDPNSAAKVTVSMPEGMKERLKRLAEESGFSISVITRGLLADRMEYPVIETVKPKKRKGKRKTRLDIVVEEYNEIVRKAELERLEGKSVGDA